MPGSDGLESGIMGMCKSLHRNELSVDFQAPRAMLRPSRVVEHPHGTRRPLQRHARSAHHRTRRTVPTGSNKCVTPELVTPPKMSNAHATSAAIAVSSVGVSNVDAMRSVRSRRLIPSEWAPILVHAVAGSHIIEPTGPVMGPNAVADVMPPGGRQEPG